jgi:hypothetical protein
LNAYKEDTTVRRIVARSFLAGLVVSLGLAIPSAQGTVEPADAAAYSAAPSAVIAVHLQSPDFTLREFKYRVFYNKSEVKRIPLSDYDFKAAFIDELVSALSEDKRLAWRRQSTNEVIDVPALWDRKVAPPQLEADILLLVNIQEYGAFTASLGQDKFYLMARFKLVQRTTGKKLWEKKLFERIDLDGNVAELQADNQKGLKVGINKVLEKLCSKLAAEIRGAKI